MTDPGLPDSPDPDDRPPGGDPGSVPDPDPDPGDDALVETSDELDAQDAGQDAAAQEEEQAPGHPLEDAEHAEDTVGEEVARDLPGAAFQK